MKIFVSSLIGGMEDFRAAAVEAIQSLGHEAGTAEAFSADANSPRVACLAGVRDANLVVLILGGRYGAIQQPSGISATHEEYREARGKKPVLAFIQQGVEREPQQAAFVQEVEDWEHGQFRAAFSTREQLRNEVTRAIHQRELALAAAPVDANELLSRALAMVAHQDSRHFGQARILLRLAVVGGPMQQILRPVEIERPELARTILQAALFGTAPIFDTSESNSTELISDRLSIGQSNGNAVSIDERGSILISFRVPSERGMGVVLEEDISERLRAGLTFSAALLDQIDSAHRLSRVVVAAHLEGSGYSAWRTRAEHQHSPNQVTYTRGFTEEQEEPVHFQPPDQARAALAYDADTITEDLVALLRRQRI
ncbi:MAG TPA: DUF4062 domain-containing protein [Sphingomicrobium sp.]